MRAGDEHQAYEALLRACVIGFSVSVLSLPLDVPRYGFWPLGCADLVQALQAAIVGIGVWKYGRGWSIRAYDLTFAVLLIPYLVTIWLPPLYDLRGGVVAEPLLLHHCLLLGIAILMPSSARWGVVLIAVFTAHGLALWRVIEQAHVVALDREPWFTLLLGGISAGLLWSRARKRDLASQLTRAEAKAEALMRLNHVVLALRDRANTPLQTIELALALVEQQPHEPDLEVALAAARRAYVDLVAVQRMLERTRLVEASTSHGLHVDLEHSLRALLEYHQPSSPDQTSSNRSVEK